MRDLLTCHVGKRGWRKVGSVYQGGWLYHEANYPYPPYFSLGASCTLQV